MQQLLLDLVSAPAPTLAGFVPGRNGELLAALHDLADGRAKERFYYLWGPPGAGKSHLLRALTGAGGVLIEAAPQLRLEEGLSGRTLIAIDDAELLGEVAAIDVFHLYNRIRESGGALLASGPCPPAQLRLRPDLLTRLAWGLVFQVHPLSDDEKIAALQSQARARGFDLGNDVGRYLLSHWRRDMASLFAALDALDRYSLQTKRPITVPLLRQAIKS